MLATMNCQNRVFIHASREGLGTFVILHEEKHLGCLGEAYKGC